MEVAKDEQAAEEARRGQEAVRQLVHLHQSVLAGRSQVPRRDGLAARTLTVKIRYSDFQTVSRACTAPRSSRFTPCISGAGLRPRAFRTVGAISIVDTGVVTT